MNYKKFFSHSTDHGKVYESAARKAFELVTEKNVFQTGLVVSSRNPWLAFSPDGVVFEENVPTELLEIKCPLKGKDMPVQEAILHEFSTCLVVENDLYCLKKKHKYYAQVQLGMCLLNVQVCNFVIYAPFDNSLMIILVQYSTVQYRMC